jgi:hypothetical protein
MLNVRVERVAALSPFSIGVGLSSDCNAPNVRRLGVDNPYDT